MALPKIITAETFTKDSVSFVRLEAEDGSEGWGQMAPFNADISALVFHRQVAPHVLGLEPNDFGDLSQVILEKEYKFPGTYVCRALSGLDTALWDMRGRIEGKSVCELLGGQPRPFPVYGSSMRRDIQPQDEADRLLRLKNEQGFGAFKIRIAKVSGHDQDQWEGRTEELVPTVRKALGNDLSLLVDANSGYTPSKAVQVGRFLEDHGVCHFEEPCPYWELDWTAQVTDALSLDVTGGEQDNHFPTWRRMITMRAVDIVQPDVCYVGGLSRALDVAALAQEHGIPCIPHSANRTWVVIFALHMMGAIPNAGPYVELGIEPGSWDRNLFEPAIEVRDGKVQIPEGPGWGVEINKDWLEKADRKITKGE